VVRDALRRVASTGVRVVLATGRAPWHGIAELADELGLDGPQITMQGALASDPRTGQVERLRSLPPVTFLDGLQFAEELGLDPVVGLIDGHRAVRRAPEADFLATGPGPARYRSEDDLRHLAHSTPIRLYLPTGPVRHQHVRAAASVWFARNASIVWSDQAGIELLGPGTDKGSAVAWLANRLGIARDEVAAVGDAPNDTAMLRYAGRSAAMGSAPEDVTRLADIVVPPSSGDGLLAALGWFFPDLADQFDQRMLPAPPIELDRYRWLRDAAEASRAGLVG
jgi:hydroxymethylpyrimidine pyrophosphatase-like HAD family hydrolase